MMNRRSFLQRCSSIILGTLATIYCPSIVEPKSEDNHLPPQILEGEEILDPTFEIAACPTVRLSEIKARRFTIYNAPHV